MAGVLPAFSFEAIFFLAVGFPPIRALYAQIPSPWLQSLFLWLSALPPFVIAAKTGGTFDSHAFLFVAVLYGLLSFWYAVLPHRTAYDVGFLVFAAAPVALRVFARLYVSPDVHLPIEVLGHLAWIHVAAFSLLVQRRFSIGPVSFWPKGSEWREGLLQFALGILPLSLISVLIRFAAFEPRHFPVWYAIGVAIGTFFGIFWVVAFSEDIVRSVITQLFLRFQQAKAIAVIGSGVLLGCAHLWYHDFPNWRFAIVAAVSHLFFTVAYLRGGSIRASMVTHALTVTTWRMLFRS